MIHAFDFRPTARTDVADDWSAEQPGEAQPTVLSSYQYIV